MTVVDAPAWPCERCGRPFPSLRGRSCHAAVCDPERDAQIVAAYVDSHEPTEAIAQRFGITATRVRAAVARTGAEMRPRHARRASSTDEPTCDRPALPGWEAAGIAPPDRMRAGLCLLCD